jgi:cytidine deaminase
MTDNHLYLSAKKVSQNAHAPYSQFKVGAAVLADNGEIYTGCNVENKAFGSTICAEGNAISSAIAAGAKHIKAVAIYTDTDRPTLPCGNCRQILSEFSAHEPIPVVAYYQQEQEYVTNLQQLLPESFQGF